MDKVFSVEEFSGQFWSPPSTPSGHPPFPASTPAQADPKMNRSESEWAFQRFLQEHAATTPLPDTSSPSKPIVEDSVVIKDQHHHKDPQSYRHENDQGLNRNNGAAPQHNNITPSIPAVAASTASFHAESNIPVNSDKFQAFLKSRLDLACAAVALTRAPYVLGQSPSGAAQSTSQQSTDSHAVTQSSVKGPKEKDVGGPIGIPSLPAMPKKLAAQINPATSGSSRDLSDDDEAEGENELNDNMDPDDSKRARRMLSNRESARRSRRRKQEHVSELETQVSELKVENSSLLNRYTDISHKYNEAAVDNRVLKADVETLRAKVKMAEETVKRVTGMNTLLQTINIPAFNGSSSGSVAAVSPYDNPKQYFYEPPAPSNPTPPRHY